MTAHPIRSCVACRSARPKAELVRFVRENSWRDSLAQSDSPHSTALPANAAAFNVRLDISGHLPGRGAYLCPKQACFFIARKKRQLDRALKSSISASNWDELEIRFTALCQPGTEEE